MTTKEPKKSVTEMIASNAQKFVDYCDIANGGLQAIFDGMMGITNNIRNYNETVIDKMSSCDLRMYIGGILNQLDGLTAQASTVMDGLLRHHDTDVYDLAKRVSSDHYAKERSKLVTEQRIKESIAIAKKYGYFKELKTAINAEGEPSKSKKGKK